MPQSLAKIYIHLVFSTKNREPLLNDAVRSDLHAYMGGILRDLHSSAIEINSESDHAHVLFLLSRTHALSDVVGQLKRGSSGWLKTMGHAFAGFHWQNGYGAFSVSQSSIAKVRDTSNASTNITNACPSRTSFARSCAVTRSPSMSVNVWD